MIRNTIVPVYVVIPSCGVGGMEKRFAEVWIRLASKYSNLYLVLSKSTYNALLARPDMIELEKFKDRVLLLDLYSTKFLLLIFVLFKFSLRMKPGVTVHYLNHAPPFIDRIMGRRVVFSWVANSFPKFTFKKNQFADYLCATIAFYCSHTIDILTPSVAERFRRSPYFDRISITTGGSFVDVNHFKPSEKKINDIVFLGRTSYMKNAVAFLEAVPFVFERMKIAGINTRFQIFGAPADQEEKVKELMSVYSSLGIPVFRGQTPDPCSVLRSAKVFVSLQRASNYPSKSLIEAMSCGCVPIINLSGESIMMANENDAVFIDEHFTVQQLADAACSILLLSDMEFMRRSKAVREFAIANFCFNKQVDYYEKVWFPSSILSEKH